MEKRREVTIVTNQFSVTLDDKPGELARLTGALAEKRINLRSTAAATWGGKGVVNIITSDEARTREVLKAQRFTYTEDQALVANVDDKPGALAQIAKDLAASGVNIKSVASLTISGAKVELAFAVDNVEKAKKATKWS